MSKHDWEYDDVRDNPKETIIIIDRKCKDCGLKQYAVIDQNEFGGDEY